MALGELRGDDLGTDPRRKLEQTKRVGDRRAVLAEARRERFLRIPVLAQEPVVGLRELEGVQVFALDVLDERELEGALGAHVLHDDERLADARALQRAPAALARDELEPIALRHATNDQRLDQAVLADARGQLVELVRVEVLSRLPLLRHDLLEGTGEDGSVAVGRRSLRGRGEQGVQASSERAPLRVRGGHRAGRSWCRCDASTAVRSETISRASDR